MITNKYIFRGKNWKIRGPIATRNAKFAENSRSQL